MAKLIMWNLMTLDGFVEGPNRDISWHSDVWGEELETPAYRDADRIALVSLVAEVR